MIWLRVATSRLEMTTPAHQSCCSKGNTPGLASNANASKWTIEAMIMTPKRWQVIKYMSQLSSRKDEWKGTRFRRILPLQVDVVHPAHSWVTRSPLCMIQWETLVVWLGTLRVVAPKHDGASASDTDWARLQSLDERCFPLMSRVVKARCLLAWLNCHLELVEETVQEEKVITIRLVKG